MRRGCEGVETMLAAVCSGVSLKSTTLLGVAPLLWYRQCGVVQCGVVQWGVVQCGVEISCDIMWYSVV